MNTKTRYTLQNKHTAALINVGGNDESPMLTLHDETPWGVDSAKKAAYVLQFPTPWYNADMETPQHNLAMEDYIVVKVIEIQQIIPVGAYFPTDAELTAFIKEEYIKPEYHNDEIAVLAMVSMYVSKKRCNMDRAMYEKFLTWAGSNNNVLNYHEFGEEL